MKAKSFSHVPGQRFLKALASAAAVLFPGVLLAASAPPQFTYQGQLMEVVNGANTPVTSGGSNIFAATMWVRLYNSTDAAKTAPLYGRKIDTSVNSGVFTIDIGDEYGVPLPAPSSNLLATISGMTDSSTLFVGITPFDDANNEIQPRQQLFSAPFALLANDASQALGNFTATNGTSLFNSLDVQGSALFMGAVTNQGAVSIGGNVTFASGFTSTAAVVTKQFAVTGTLSTASKPTVQGAFTVNSGATFNNTLTVTNNTTLTGDATVTGLMTVTGNMDSDNMEVKMNQLTLTAPINIGGVLNVNSNAVFGSYLPGYTWSGQSTDYTDASHGPTVFTAATDGLYVFSLLVRKDGWGGGGVDFQWGSSLITPRLYSDVEYGSFNYAVTVLLLKGESVSLGNFMNEHVTDSSLTTRLYYRAFENFMSN